MNVRKIILIAFVFSGMAALIYEVVWTRPLQFVLGSTVYTISIIFAAFMAGLALGSWTISRFVERITNLPLTYALMQLGIGLYGILLLFIFNLLPDAYRTIYPLRGSFYLFELIQFLLSFLILLVPTTLMGATFPIIVKFYTDEKIGKGIGEIYSANNLGAIAGSFAAGFLLIPILGIKSTVIFAGFINLFIAFLILFISSRQLAKKVIPIVAVLFLILSYTGNYNIEEFHTSGFRAGSPKDILKKEKMLYYKEGLHTTVAVRELSGGGIALFFNGRGQGSSLITDLRVNSLLAYLPLLLKPESKESLVIGLGTGTTSGQLAQFINVTTVEIEPAVLGATEHFFFMNFNVLENSNHKLVMADGRNYLLQSKKKYDIIVQEPSDPWLSFSAALYSKEFFELTKSSLNENGLYVQWVPIFELSISDFKSFYRTFNSVFPYVIAFANVKEDEPLPVRIETSEIILIGSNQKIDFNREKIRKNFDTLPKIAKEYLNAIKLSSSDQILHLFLFTDEEMKGYGTGAPLITDDNPKLEFSTAKRVLHQNPKEVISDIEKFLGVKGGES
jgi:spermidine synthase